MNFARRNFLRLAAAAPALSLLPNSAGAQSFPSRPLRLVVGYTAGSAPDVAARLLADSLSSNLGQQVITPKDLERTYGMTGGHPFHGELALDQFFTMRPLLDWARYQTPIKGLYLCGSSTHPGIGLSGTSGSNARRNSLAFAKPADFTPTDSSSHASEVRMPLSSSTI